MRLSVGRRIGGVWFGVSFGPQLGRKHKATRYWTHPGETLCFSEDVPFQVRIKP
jgi:hypothetical protein